MRDLLSKLDAVVSETTLKDKEDLEAKRKALDDLEADPVASKDPEISAAIDQRRSDLEKEAESKGFTEDQDLYMIGDDFGISFGEEYEIGTEITDILEDGIVIDLDESSLEYLLQNGFSFEDIQVEEKQKGLDGKACWKGYRRQGTKMKGGRRVDNCVKVGEGFESELEQGRFYIVGYKGEPMADPSEPGSGPLSFDSKEEAESFYSGMSGREMDEYEIMKFDGDNFQPADSVDEAEYRGRKVPLGKKMAGDVKKSKVYVRKPNGKVVKVNFGDKKMRIKKSNPARRKSFRARHNCKNPGPRWKARYWSCRSW